MVKKFLYGTFDISHKYKKIPHEVLRPRNYEVNPTGVIKCMSWKELYSEFTKRRGHYMRYRENPKTGNYPFPACPYVKQYTLTG